MTHNIFFYFSFCNIYIYILSTQFLIKNGILEKWSTRRKYHNTRHNTITNKWDEEAEIENENDNKKNQEESRKVMSCYSYSYASWISSELNDVFFPNIKKLTHVSTSKSKRENFFAFA